jgi:hypothetical protein
MTVLACATAYMFACVNACYYFIQQPVAPPQCESYISAIEGDLVTQHTV